MMFQHKIQLSDFETLSLRWQSDWSHLTIKFNTTEVENITNKTILEAGKWFALPTGKNLFVRLVKNELEVWDGSDELMSGLKSGQSDKYGQAWKMLIGCGIVITLLGVGIGSGFASDTKAATLELSIGIGLTGLGLGYIGLALWARKIKEKLPLQIAMGVHSILAVLMLLGGTVPGILNAIVLYNLYKGLKAEPLKTTKFQYVKDTGLLDDDL
jgi:hypothetical protein